MKFVVAAVQRAFAGLSLCVGLLALVWTLLAKTQLDAMRLRPVNIPRPILVPGYYVPTAWDIPIALGVLAATVLAAALIYPSRRP